MKTVINTAPMPEAGRLIAVSDIHGQLDWLNGLLDKLRFSENDTLVIVGDIVEKGPNSLATLRRVMALCAEGRAMAVLGNMEAGVLSVFSDDSTDERLAEYGLVRKNDWGASLVDDMAKEAGLSLESGAAGLLPRLRERFAKELGFLKTLPTILLIQRYLFVHGGVPTDDLDALGDVDAAACLKCDEFLAHAPAFSRWVIVGHWPVTLYHADYDESSPLIDRARRIASIDGGCVLKRYGQLNGLVLPKDYTDDFTWEFYDGFPECVALDAQAASADPVNVRWGRSDVTVLREAGDSCDVLHHLSGRVLSVPRDELYRHGDRVDVGEYTDYWHGVTPGETVRLAARYERGALVKKGGLCGWYAGRFKE